MNNRKNSALTSKTNVLKGREKKLVLSSVLQGKLSLAVKHHQQKQFEIAAPLYELILDAHPDHFDALQLYATLLAQTGQLEKALAILIKVTEVARNQGIDQQKLVGVFNNLGNVYRALGRLELAVSSYEEAILLNSHYADAHNNKGLVLAELFRFEEAVLSYQQALRINPNFVQSLSNMGSALRECGQYTEALKAYDHALELNPQYAQAHANKGLVLQDMQSWDAALTAYKEALKIRPDYAEALNNCANIYKKLGLKNEARQYYLAAIGLRSDYADALNNLGSLFKEDHQFDQALQCYSKALELNPGYCEALYNRGNLYKDLRYFKNALVEFSRAVHVKPSFAEANLNIAIVNLTLGEMKKGWAGFEWRWKSTELRETLGLRCFEQPLWLGRESLVGKTILLYCEQGLGDTIQFCRYAQVVQGLGARVILEVQHELFTLLGSLPGVDTLIKKGVNPPPFDFQCPLMSLPLALNMSLQNIPNPDGYIQCDQAAVNVWSTRLDSQSTRKPMIGLVWCGNPKHLNDRNRSLPLNQLRVITSLGCQFVGLQKEWSDADKNMLGDSNLIQDVSTMLQDFGDTAALLEVLDLIITVDTSVAHLAGAMGKQVWVLLPFNSDWRWLEHKVSTPWYSSMTLYRQSNFSDWGNVLERVKSDLSQMFGLTPDL